MADIASRIKVFKTDAVDSVLQELVTIITDRIKLRAGIEEGENLPSSFNSIVVEVGVALYNRYEMNHEGVSSEGVEGFNIKFIEDVLDNYDKDIQAYKDTLKKKQGACVVKFL